MDRYSGLKEFYWAKEKIRKLYRQESRQEATKLLDNIIFNLKSADDAELIRWGNTLKHWGKPSLNHLGNDTTNGFTGGCDTKIKMLKQVSYGLRNLEVYWGKCSWGLYHPQAISTQFDKEPDTLLFHPISPATLPYTIPA